MQKVVSRNNRASVFIKTSEISQPGCLQRRFLSETIKPILLYVPQGKAFWSEWSKIAEGIWWSIPIILYMSNEKMDMVGES